MIGISITNIGVGLMVLGMALAAAETTPPWLRAGYAIVGVLNVLLGALKFGQLVGRKGGGR